MYLKTNNKRRSIVPFDCSLRVFLLDFVAVTASFFVSYALAGFVNSAFGFVPVDAAYLLETNRHLIFTGLAVSLLFLLFSKGHYTNRIPWWSQVLFIAKTCLFTLFVDAFVSFLLELTPSRVLITLNWVLCFGFLVIARFMAFNFFINRAKWQRPTVIIGDIPTITDVLYAFNADPCTGYAPHTLLLRDRDHQNFDLETVPYRYRDIKHLEGNGNCKTYIVENPDDFYVISLDSFRGDKRDEILAALQKVDAQYAIVPAINRVSLYDREPRYFFGNDVMMLHSKTLDTPVRLIAKRAMDIVISFGALTVFSPIMLAVIICLKLEGQGGSLFYGCKRIGRDGREFNCWKFRSMEPNSDHLLEALLKNDPQARREWETYHKIKNDPRITTRTARIIRKTSLDELPQLWNVLVGDMSIVGPRPILEHEKSAYGSQLADYLKVKPGITGLWQVSGRNAVSFKRRIYWDSWYIRNWSIWGDLVIILKTVPALLSRNTAF